MDILTVDRKTLTSNASKRILSPRCLMKQKGIKVLSSSSISSSSSSSDSSSDEDEIKSEPKRIQVSFRGEKLFSIEHIASQRMQYYIITQIHCYDMHSFVRPGDAVVLINDEDIKDVDAEHVQKLCRHCCEDENTIMLLRIWRWTKGKIEQIEFKIRSMPYGKYDKVDDIDSDVNFTPPPRRQILSWKWSGQEKAYTICIEFQNEKFVCVKDGNLATDTPTSECDPRFILRLKYFKCEVKSPNSKKQFRFGAVIQYHENGQTFDVVSRIAEGKPDLQLQLSKPVTEPDERFFIEYETHNEDIVFESLPFFDHYMRFNNNKNVVEMAPSGVSPSKVKRSFLYQTFTWNNCNRLHSSNSHKENAFYCLFKSCWGCSSSMAMYTPAGDMRFQRREMFKLHEVPDKCLRQCSASSPKSFDTADCSKCAIVIMETSV